MTAPIGAGAAIPPHDPALQALRGLAIALVCINHYFPALLPGGFVGVDIFFVLSGFLITRIVRRDLALGQFSFLGFYSRRARRIIPSLVVVIAASLIAGYFLLAPEAYRALGKNAFAAAFFAANFRSELNYFSPPAAFEPLLHLWSLAVEEQFYLLFPLLLWALWPRWKARHMAWLLLALAAASLILSQLMLTRLPVQAFYSLPPRAFELLMGAVLAFPPSWPWRLPLRPGFACGLGLGCIAAAAVLFHASMAFPGLAALLPCGGAALVISALAGQGRPMSPELRRMVSFWPLVFLGDISYALYLWHWPPLALMKTVVGVELSLLQRAVLLAFSVAAAVIATFAIEQPLRRLARPPGLTIASAGAALAALGMAALLIFYTDGLPQRFSAPAQALLAAKHDVAPAEPECRAAANATIDERTCGFPPSPGHADIAVWGDSHGRSLAEILSERASGQGRSVRRLITSSCPPALGFVSPFMTRCAERNAAVLGILLEDKSITTVVLAANALAYGDEAQPQLQQGFTAAVAALRRGGKAVWLIKQQPVMPYALPERLEMQAYWGRNLSEVGLDGARHQARAAVWNSFLEGLAKAEGADAYDPAQVLCQDGFCHAYLAQWGGLYADMTHLSLAGARYAFGGLAKALYGEK